LRGKKANGSKRFFEKREGFGEGEELFSSKKVPLPPQKTPPVS